MHCWNFSAFEIERHSITPLFPNFKHLEIYDNAHYSSLSSLDGPIHQMPLVADDVIRLTSLKWNLSSIAFNYLTW